MSTRIPTPIGEQFGKADVYDNAKINSASRSRITGSGAKGKINTREERGKVRKGNRGDANLTNREDQNGETDNQIQEGIRRIW